MKGDFTRWTFDPSKRYSSVRLQQGRVLLDADWNEQLDIMAHREQIANQEIIGLHGVPDLDSFAVDFEDNEQIKLGEGRCYVEGVLCENRKKDYKRDLKTEVLGLKKDDSVNPGDYLVYLEVWQHHITAIEEDELVEPALGGPDTTTRTQTIWQLKALKLEDKGKWRQECKELLDKNQEKGKLKVKSGTGLPNDLYRVEIHEVAKNVEDTTFKWARNNASMAARVLELGDETVKIEKNNQIQFPEGQKEGTWIEITNEDRVKAGEPGVFLEVLHVLGSNDGLILTVKKETGSETEIRELKEQLADNKITTVRIWEANAREIKLNEDETYTGFIELEKGLQVTFDLTGTKKYRTGDYWLIPTRSQQEVVWPQEGGGPDGIVYHYCPLAIVNYDQEKWTVPQDCREVFPALTEMARETVLYDQNRKVKTTGRKLSIGVHSYNDARRAGTESSHTEDQLNIQGGTQLTLNAGYWQDELEEELPVPDEKTAISFTICEEEVMRLTKDQLTSELSITGNKNLIVEGTSWLKDVVCIGTGEIGTEKPDSKIGLKVKPDLSIESATQGQVVGLKLEPTLTAKNDEDKLTGLHICPNYKGKENAKKYSLIVEGKVGFGKPALLDKNEYVDTGNGDGEVVKGIDFQPYIQAKNPDQMIGLYIKPEFQNQFQHTERYGLVVEEGKVSIGKGHKKYQHQTEIIRMGVDMRPSVSARSEGNLLAGLFISPDFQHDVTIHNKDKYGLIVEGKVGIGPHKTACESPVKVPEGSEYPVELDSIQSKVANLLVTGNLEVYGTVTSHALKEEPGDVELGQQNRDQVKIYGKLTSEHESGKLKVTSPLEVQLEGNNNQDFLSLFATNESNVNGRIVWKKGTVTEREDDSYEELAKEVAAIYSITNGDGSDDSSTGDLRFGTSASGEPLTDRVVITADGNVGIGQIHASNPGDNQLKVTGTTDLDTLVVNTKLEVKQGANTDLHSLKITGNGNRFKPTLLIPDGNVCIGAEEIPDNDLINGTDVKLYVTGGSRKYVSIDTNLSVFGSTDVDTLTVTPDLTATQNNEELIAAEINPSFLNVDDYSNVKRLALKVVQGDVVLDKGNLNIKSGQLVFGTPAASTSDKLRVTGGSTLLEGDLQVGKDSIALKVNQETQGVGIGGESESDYKLAVTGNTKLTGKLQVAPELEGTSNATEIRPTFTGTGIQTAVLIDPKINVPIVAQKGRKKKSQIRSADLITATQFGLHVVNGNVALCSTTGGVAIGSINPETNKLKVTGGSTLLEGILRVAPELDWTSNATEITPTFTSTGDSQTLTAVKINPNFPGEDTAQKKLGLLVESGDVQVGGDSNIALKVNQENSLTDIIFDKTAKSLIKWESKNNYTSDFAYIFFKDKSKYTKSRAANVGAQVDGSGPNFTEENDHVRLSIGVGNDVKEYATNQDALDIQGGACLTLNVGAWDKEITEEISPAVTDEPIGISFRVNDDQKMFIDHTGAVGIGTTVAPPAKLQVSGGAIMPAAGNTEDSGILFPKDPGIGYGDAAWIRYYVREGEGTGENTTFEIGTSNDPKDHIVLKTSGAVGIGKVPNSDGGVKLDVDGKIRTTDGVLTTSDATLKENVKPLKNGLKNILRLRGVSYQWKDEQKASQETQIGL
ncbi:MAG: tail fiber domain-containing protein, partial [Moorea sp. SIO2I5]|nr:tail fiber domain-containing protein [Moorena sp. SIO2I5]